MELKIKELWRYPVKSMQGERLDTVDVSSGGFAFDRAWAIRDDEARTIRGAKHLGELLQCKARYVSGQPGLEDPVPTASISFPDGAELNTDDPKLNHKLSELVGRRVSLWPLQPATNESHYRINRFETGNFISELRRMMALEESEPLPDLSGFPPNLARQLTKFAVPPGTYFDAFPLNVLTEASLRYLRKLLPESKIDVLRFRPNILVEGAPELSEALEESWIGRTLLVGEAEFKVVMGCPRCIMVTRAQARLPDDPSIMRTLVREANQSLSVYGEIVHGGTLRIGQPVTVA